MNKSNGRFLLVPTAAVLVACGPSGNGDAAPADEPAEAEVAAVPEDGEESAEQLTKDQIYDHERAGSRLVLAYDEAANSFAGTVENVGAEPLSRVRVEVHLSNGIELGPTPPADLAPGETRPVSLDASQEPFETWSAHAEVGGAEGEHEGQGEHEGEEGHEGGEPSEEHGGSEKSGEGREAPSRLRVWD